MLERGKGGVVVVWGGTVVVNFYGRLDWGHEYGMVVRWRSSSTF